VELSLACQVRSDRSGLLAVRSAGAHVAHRRGYVSHSIRHVAHGQAGSGRCLASASVGDLGHLRDVDLEDISIPSLRGQVEGCRTWRAASVTVGV
jgi:hypothetical protein